ncbi:hypothetical protein PVAP13_5NG071381 [Panicum virgatum]|uniref:Uncharacterized protein n=1 Tax=Panicum virgatum TaxID=38727 RepID=A0A8T0RNU0_PANVG|nr:hypothetical protein PVAP13_5NG071381 [Panicum virgatum]
MASTVPRGCGGGAAAGARAHGGPPLAERHPCTTAPTARARVVGGERGGVLDRRGERRREGVGVLDRCVEAVLRERAPATTPCAASTPWPRAPFYTGDALRVPFPASPPPQAVGAPGFIVSAGREPIQEHPRVRKGSWLPRRHSLAAGEPPMAGVSARPRAAA